MEIGVSRSLPCSDSKVSWESRVRCDSWLGWDSKPGRDSWLGWDSKPV